MYTVFPLLNASPLIKAPPVFVTNLSYYNSRDSVCVFVCPTFYSETIGATDVKLGGWVQLGMGKNQFMFARSSGSRSRSNFKLLRSGSNLGKVILPTGRVRKTYGEGGRTGSRSRSNFKLLRSDSNLGKVILHTGRVRKTYREGGRSGSRSNFKLLQSN